MSDSSVDKILQVADTVHELLDRDPGEPGEVLEETLREALALADRERRRWHLRREILLSALEVFQRHKSPPDDDCAGGDCGHCPRAEGCDVC